jgi:rhomboid protease GluP
MGSYPPQYEGQPEIMPPVAQAPPRRVRPSWAAAPATYLLLGINIAVFLVMVLRGVGIVNPDPQQLLHWGADEAGRVLLEGQWWRIVTAMFVHVGIIHIGLNMWCLWNLGLLAEPLMGSAGVIAVYLLTGAAGNLLSTAHNYLWPAYDNGTPVYAVGAGASGAIFGIAGALIVLLGSKRLPVPPEDVKKLRRSVILFAVINLIIPIGANAGANALHAGVQIDYMAHIGGVLCGLLFAAPMVPRLGSPRKLFELRLRVAVGMVTGVLVLFGVFLSSMVR